jgi:tRNA A-37 threonylcarbamoyl transferase component Bud32
MRRIDNPSNYSWAKLDKLIVPVNIASRAQDFLSETTGNYGSWRYEQILKERTQDFKAFRVYPSESSPQDGAWMIKIPRDNELWRSTLDSRVKSQYLEYEEGYSTSEFDNILDYVKVVNERIPEEPMIGISRVEHIDKEFLITKYAPGEAYGDLNNVRFDSLKHLSWTLGRLNKEGIFLADFHNENFVIDANKAYIIDQGALAVVKGMSLNDYNTTNMRDLLKVISNCDTQLSEQGVEYTLHEVERCFEEGFKGKPYSEDFEL